MQLCRVASCSLLEVGMVSRQARCQAANGMRYSDVTMSCKQSNSKGTNGNLCALEFFSGIGGMHYALKQAAPAAQVLGAFDINPNANDVYEHNFGQRPTGGSICQLTAEQLDAFGADLWLLAPPCQPYTRRGLQQGTADMRASPFLWLLSLLARLKRPPKYLLVENVEGFETSDTRDTMAAALSLRGYALQEWILSPSGFGVPYSRPRYFAIALQQKLGGSEWRVDPPSLPGTLLTRSPLSPKPCNQHDRTMAASPAPCASVTRSARVPSAAAGCTARSSASTEESVDRATNGHNGGGAFRSDTGAGETTERGPRASEGSDVQTAARARGGDATTSDTALHLAAVAGIPAPPLPCRPLGEFLVSDPRAEGMPCPEAPPPNNKALARSRAAAGLMTGISRGSSLASVSPRAGAPPFASGVETHGAGAPDVPGGTHAEPDAAPSGREGAPDGAGRAWDLYTVPTRRQQRCGEVFDIVTPSSTRVNCFTKTYSRYAKVLHPRCSGCMVRLRANTTCGRPHAVLAEGCRQELRVLRRHQGSGSVLATSNVAPWDALREHPPRHLPPDELAALLGTLQLRYFTPREIANLHGFPPEFSFPAHVTLKQRYALLGNSLSVLVVARLLEYLFAM